MTNEAVKGRGRCPKCASRKVTTIDQPITPFYAVSLEVCGNCRAVWEPMPEGGNHLDCDGTPFPFPDPCSNCAFTPGSHEQQDTEEWKKTISMLKAGGQFFCHKGVVLEINGETGFAYPQTNDPNADDSAKRYDTKKMRTCRGYLNMISRHWRKEFGEPEPIEEITA